ncbi:MAG TPA: molybdopterin cofactor-binding domain-containing protein, partial [Coriobacteriia bacterium]|nr:molybdopterin cofactor-binding domain-containing protein [Coriobacteriia bacterium]
MSDALRSQSNGIPLEHGLIGTKTKRYGGLERAMGAQKYVADLDFPDALQVAIVTIPVGCADILGVDTTAAEAMPGVVKVLTAADLPSPMPRFGVSHKDRPVMADRRVNFFGEPVAAVAAETKEQAEAAARAVRVAYRELPGAYTLDDALAPGGHIVQDPSDPTVRPKDPLRETNVLEGQTIAWGDIAEQETLAALVVEDSYTYPMMTQFPIEPLGFVVEPTDAGGIDIYCPVQHPFLLQRIVADLVGLPLTRVRVVAPDPGGGFGGKQIPKL